MALIRCQDSIKFIERANNFDSCTRLTILMVVMAWAVGSESARVLALADLVIRDILAGLSEQLMLSDLLF